MGYGGRGYGYTEGGYGYGVSDFVGVADVLRGLGGDPYSAWALRRLSGRYGGPVARLRRSSDNAELDFFGQGPLGLVSTDAVRAWNGWNLAGYTENLADATGWTTSPTSGTGSAPIRTLLAGQGPNGRDATRIQFALNGGTTTSDVSAIVNASGVSVVPVNGTQYTMSLWAKSNDSNSYSVLIRYSNQTSVVTVTPTWQRFIMTRTAGSDVTRFYVGLRGAQTPATSNAADILISEPQLEVASSFSTYEPRTTTGAGSSFLVTLYDQTGQGRHFTQATTTLQPIVCEQGVPVTEGGRLAAKFVAADSRRMAVASSAALYNFLHTTGGSVAAICQMNDTAALKCLLSNKSTTTAAGIMIEASTNETLNWYVGRRDVAGVATDGRTVGVEVAESSTANRVIVGVIDPDNATAADRGRIWHNGTASAVTNAETATPFVENAVTNLTLGARSNGSQHFDGTIQDVLVWDMLISDDVRDAYEADAGRFFSITVA